MSAKTKAFRLSLTLALLAAPVSLPAAAQPGSPFAGRPDLSIAAVVGEEAISSYDVENRIRFIIATARISDTPDVLKVIRPQVIRSLVDEKLQVQEAKKSGIDVSAPDVAAAIAGIEQDRGMPPGTIAGMLAAAGVPKESFDQQIRAQLLWSKLLARKVRPHMRVNDEELRIATRRYSMTPPRKKEAPAVPQEYRIAVIALPVEKKGQEERVRTLAYKLVQQIRSGASFEEVSRQFSSVAANSGGKVESFWVRLGQLDPAVAMGLNGAQKGAVTDAMRTQQGYTIIKVYDTRPVPGARPKPQPKEEEEPRDTEVTLKEILLRLRPDTQAPEADVMLRIGGEVARNPGTCDDESVASIDNTRDMDIDVAFHSYMLSEMPPALKDLTDRLETGQISPPVATYEGIRLYMLCGRRVTDSRPVNKELVHAMLVQQKMDLEAQKYLRNLRRETFIDIRQ